MKALNYKERRRTILQFTVSLLPFILLTFSMLVLFREVGIKHSTFIQEKYDRQKELFVDQSEYNERLDSVLVLLDKLMDHDVNTGEYKQLHKLINDKIQNSVNKLKQDDVKPYELIFLEARKAQAVIDSIYPLKQDHVRNRIQLKTCIKKYHESRVKLQRQENASGK